MKYVTLIGSREVPEEVADLQQKMGYKLASMGYHGRSGAAGGSDTNFLKGYCQYAIDKSAPLLFTNYIPWDKFKYGCIDELKKCNLWREDFMESFVVAWSQKAEEIASEIHPKWRLDKQVEAGEMPKPKNWRPMGQGAKKLHTRNVYQLLGHDLATPAIKVFCYAKEDDHGNIKGGTATACTIAKKNGIPVRNLFLPDYFRKATWWVEEDT